MAGVLAHCWRVAGDTDGIGGGELLMIHCWWQRCWRVAWGSLVVLVLVGRW